MKRSVSLFLLLCVWCLSASCGDSPDGIIGIGTSPLSCPPVPSTVSGMDVSGHQHGINWDKVSSSKLLEYSFIKATEGLTFTNPDFASDWVSSLKVGVIRGPYHYFLANDDPIQQADFFLSTVGNLDTGDLPPALDVEVFSGESANVVAQRALQWLEYVEKKTGRTPIVYTFPNFWHKLGDPSGFERFPLYISHPDVPCPEVPGPWKTWLFWQDTNKNSFPGVPGPVDHDFFQGNGSDLQNFIGKSPGPHIEKDYQ